MPIYTSGENIVGIPVIALAAALPAAAPADGLIAAMSYEAGRQVVRVYRLP